MKKHYQYNNAWDRLNPERITPDRFCAVIEIPKGSKQKYEVDESTGMIRLDRILYTSTHYPANYGFIPQTHSEDGDPLDVLVMCSESLAPLCLVDCYPIGAFNMLDDNQQDEKIIAIPFGDPQYNSWKDLSDLPKHVYTEIKHFFSVYKELEGKQTSLRETYDAAEARDVIQRSLNRYRELRDDYFKRNDNR